MNIWNLIVAALMLYGRSWCFNLNSFYPDVFHQSSGSYFGYSVELHGTSSGPVALVGAPKGNSLLSSAREPGVIYKCPVATPTSCQEVRFDNGAGNQSLGRELQDGMWLGMSLTSNEQGNGDVLACAPRLRVIMTQGDNVRYVGNGMCYLIDRNLNTKTTRKLLPLTVPDKQTLFSQNLGLIYNYAYGQVGLSTFFNQDTNEIVMGAPGLHEWTGSVVMYPDSSSQPSIPDMPASVREKSPYIYAGYAVSSGRFFEHSEKQYVLGAPRDAGHLGQVYIFDIRPRTVTSKAAMNSTTIQKGTQVGEYFGASVLAVNLNGDKYSDLVVGAPLFSRQQTSWDNGRIYVYLSSGVGLIAQKPCSVKSATDGSRFGSTLAAIGDLNQDGYQDIAVGAPYEQDMGAVYIFLGSETGLVCEIAQRILASDVGVGGPGFGMAISRGLDVDANRYPDVLIGSYGDDQAVLLRSQPVVHVFPGIESTAKDIDITLQSCAPTNTPSSQECFKVTFGLMYTGVHVPQSLTFVLNVTLERDLQEKGLGPRAFFDSGGSPVISFQEKITLSKDSKKSIQKRAFIQPSSEKYISPVTFSMTHRVESGTSGFCKTCPVVDPSSQTSAELKVPFKFGCGDDSVCTSDLLLSARIVEQKDAKTPFILGIDETLTILAVLTNRGEDAYAATVLVELPSDLPIIKMGQCYRAGNEAAHQTKRTRLECPVGNPFGNKQTHTLEVKVDTSRLSGQNQTLDFFLEATTVSEKKNTSRNIQRLSATFVTNMTLDIYGYPNADNVIYDPQTESAIFFQHTYKVRALYSKISRVHLDFFVPGFDSFITQASVEASGSATCSSFHEVEDVVPQFQYLRSEPEAPESEKLVQASAFLDCSRATCKPISCVAGPIDRRVSGIVTISGYLNLTILKSKHQYELSGIDILTTRGEAYIGVNQAGVAIVTTKLVEAGPLPGKSLSVWIIVASAVGGVVLLTFIAIGLYKLGFFKRRRLEEEEERRNASPLLNQKPPDKDES